MPYRYEDIDDKRFQKLCQSLLTEEYRGIACLPVGQADGGRDAKAVFHIFQVKWTGNPKRLENPVQTLARTIEGEKESIRRLVSDGAQRYTLLTNVSSTARYQSGTFDKLEKELDRLSEENGVPMSCWWREDIDARLDKAPWELKLSFSEVLIGPVALLALHSRLSASSGTTIDRLIRDFTRSQWIEDTRVRFREIELDHPNLEDLFIDVEAAPRGRSSGYSNPIPPDQRTGEPAARWLLQNPPRNRVVVLGAPGQGKSTLLQFLCQVHRAGLLKETEFLKRLDAELVPPTELHRIVFRVDLRDLATFLVGRDPFDDQLPQSRLEQGTPRTLEAFLAHLVTNKGSGAKAEISDIQSIIDRYPVMLALDGLDEVADPSQRAKVVGQIEKAVGRLEDKSVSENLLTIVTSRPSHSQDLAEPGRAEFAHVELLPLRETLRMLYLSKWSSAKELDAADDARLVKLFRERSIEPHVRELAQNPMQLSILLHLIQQRLDSLPRKRTQLYADYMSRFLDREAMKDATVRQYREELEEVTSFLAWDLQSMAEQGSPGRLPIAELKRKMRHYLVDQEKDVSLVDSLFTAATTRVWALSSRSQGFFEFDVQPIREYLAARFLAEIATSNSRSSDKFSRFAEVSRRPYWLNTTRFMAGFFSKGELGTLSDDIQDQLEGSRSVFLRRMCRYLLHDDVFGSHARANRRVIGAAFDTIGTRALLHDLIDEPQTYPPESAQAELAKALKSKIGQNPKAPIAAELGALLATCEEGQTLGSWWTSKVHEADDDTRDSWLTLGASIRAGEFVPLDVVDGWLTYWPDVAPTVVATGASASAGSTAESAMMAAVFSGEVTGADCRPVSLPARLAIVFDPDRFATRLPFPSENAAIGAPLHHPNLGTGRSQVARYLRRYHPEWTQAIDALRLKAGQTGTTALWQDTAREITRVVGAQNWLSKEISIMAAGAPSLITGGTNPPLSESFGAEADPAALVEIIRVHRRDPHWWKRTIADLTNELDRASWVFAALACGEDLDAEMIWDVLVQLPMNLRLAVQCASARFGQSRRGRALPPETAMRFVKSNPRLSALLAHHVAERHKVEVFRRVSPEARAELATDRVLGWPLVALGLESEYPELNSDLELMRLAGPNLRLNRFPAFDRSAAALVGDSPDSYPWLAVLRSDDLLEPGPSISLQEFAMRDRWFD